MAEPSDSEVDAALARGWMARQREPRAVGVHFDRHTGQIVVALTNGSTFMFPPRLVQGLETATPEQLMDAMVLGSGTGLHWEQLDVDLSIAGLLAGVFGTAATIRRQARAARVDWLLKEPLLRRLRSGRTRLPARRGV